MLDDTLVKLLLTDVLEASYCGSPAIIVALPFSTSFAFGGRS